MYQHGKSRTLHNMAHKTAATLGILLALTLTGCATTTPTAEPTATPTTPQRSDVDWTKYPDTYQQIVDEETTAQNCDALQDMFDAAPDDPDLLGYLDEAMRLADCY